MHIQQHERSRHERSSIIMYVSHQLTFARKVFPAQAQPEATLASRGRELRAANGQLGHCSFPKFQAAPGPLPIHLGEVEMVVVCHFFILFQGELVSEIFNAAD